MTRAEINLSALTDNLNGIRGLCGGKEVLAVVKANAYGHGTELVSASLHKQGVRNFAVSSVFEADAIRDIVPDSDIIIFGATPEELTDRVAENNYVQTVVSVEHAQRICRARRAVRAHIKIDTGMTRYGISTFEDLQQIMQMPELKVEGLFTHFSSADSLDPADREFTLNQQSKFVEFVSKYSLKTHSQNTAGVLYHSEFGGEMVRAGIALYGYRPNTMIEAPFPLKAVMSLKSEITQIREVGAGVPVSYGRHYVTDSPRKLAVIPVGYADGYSRLHSDRGKVEIAEKIAPVRGRVCMDYIIADITDTDGVSVGDEVVIYSDTNKEIGIEHIADSIGTIPYEVTCAVSARVPRVAVDK
jgi:alanine racemase